MFVILKWMRDQVEYVGQSTGELVWAMIEASEGFPPVILVVAPCAVAIMLVNLACVILYWLLNFSEQVWRLIKRS